MPRKSQKDVVIDFSQAVEPGEEPAAYARDEHPLVPLMPVKREVRAAGIHIDPMKLEAAKATFTATGGNLAAVASAHDLAPNVVKKLAAELDWPVYGDGLASSEKSRKGKLEKLYAALERQVLAALDSLEIETKEKNTYADKGSMSVYVATLSQRNSTFAALFDRYLRVGALLEPELFGNDPDPSNTAAAKVRAKAHQDALGGVEGLNRQMADFAARLAVGIVDHMGARSVETGEVIDVEPTEG